MNKFLTFLNILLIVFLCISCNEYQKVLKSEDIKIKYDLAEKYYDNQEFRKASRLFEQIKPKYRGKPQGERITFFYANCLLNIKSYVLASYEFESFVKAYPLSQKVEDAKYLSAFAYYKTSPSHSLDQGETIEAIDVSTNSVTTVQEVLGDMMGDAPACNECGHITIRNGSCYKCLNCGNSLGCS